MNAALDLGKDVGQAAACRALALPRATPRRALHAVERQRVLDALHSERFRDKAPA